MSRIKIFIGNKNDQLFVFLKRQKDIVHYFEFFLLIFNILIIVINILFIEITFEHVV